METRKTTARCLPNGEAPTVVEPALAPETSHAKPLEPPTIHKYYDQLVFPTTSSGTKAELEIDFDDHLEE